MGKVVKHYIIIKQNVTEIFLVIEMLPRRLPCYLCHPGFQPSPVFLMQLFNPNIMGIQHQHIISTSQHITKQQELNKHCSKHISNNNKPLFKLLIINFRLDLVPIL